jgi:hypothetical protein
VKYYGRRSDTALVLSSAKLIKCTILSKYLP